MALNSLAKQGRFSEVLSLLEAMESASIKPPEVTFGTAINGAARANNSAAAVALLLGEALEFTGLKRSTVSPRKSWSSALHGLIQYLYDALELLKAPELFRRLV